MRKFVLALFLTQIIDVIGSSDIYEIAKDFLQGRYFFKKFENDIRIAKEEGSDIKKIFFSHIYNRKLHLEKFCQYNRIIRI
jgi:hypothetical protein